MTEPKRYALDELSTIEQAAELIGITPRVARDRALKRGLGRIYGIVRILTPEDVEALAEYIEPHVVRQAKKEARNGNG